jgi:hypothetical protein
MLLRRNAIVALYFFRDVLDREFAAFRVCVSLRVSLKLADGPPAATKKERQFFLSFVVTRVLAQTL